jgi:pyridoxine kinase
VGRAFHGTGDLFASVLTGALVKGKCLYDAAEQAADFVRICVAHTAPQNTPDREGVDFEPMLPSLFEGAGR